MAKRWTTDEEEHLLALLKTNNSLAECSATLQRTASALSSRLEKIALEMYNTDKSIERIHEITKLSVENIQKLIYLQNLPNHNAEWDSSQEVWLKKYILKYGAKECAAKMGRTENEINTRLLSLAIDEFEKTETIPVYSVEKFIEKITLMRNDFVLFEDMEKLKNPPYYVVLNGRYKGIYNTLEGARMSTVGFPDAKFKMCNTLPEIKKYIKILPIPVIDTSIVLSDEQNDVIKAVLNGKNVLLMGSGGTGKSTLIKHLTYICNEKGINIGITASTGSAAVLIDGKTVHSYLGIGLAKDTPKALASTLFYKYKKKATELKNLKILLIDEISMIDGNLLSKISAFLSIVRSDSRHFGGLQIILSGDMYQLPPVTGILVFKSDIWNEIEFSRHILTKIYRQENDMLFQEILERAKLGAITDEDLKILKSCKGQHFTEGIKPTCLYATNSKVDLINNEEYNLLKENEMEYKTAYSNKESKSYCDNIGVPGILKLKIGAQVMVTRNVNSELKLANGTRGVVVNMFPDYVVIQTLHGCREIRPFECINENDKHLTYSVIPLKLAWAVTIHKAQGVTLDCCKIDIGESLFAYGQAYTALSRVKNLNGLCVINITKSAFKTHPDVLEFYRAISRHDAK
jgi:ribosomal protein L7Ae-like RNA K-turn-binding protein